MSEATLTPPRPRAAPRATPPPRPARRPPRRRGDSRTLAIGLALSLLFHLLLLTLSPLLFQPRLPPAPVGRLAPPPAAPAGTQVLEIVATTTTPPSIEDQLERLRERPQLPRTTAPTPAAAPADETPVERPGLTSVERLRPRIHDERLWSAPALAEPSEADRVRDRVYARIQEMNDSIAAGTAAAERATDWTYKDGEGGRWGVSPGKIHLGKITLPLPIGGMVHPLARDEMGDRTDEWRQIQQGADLARIRDRFDERARAIRERKDAERKN